MACGIRLCRCTESHAQLCAGLQRSLLAYTSYDRVGGEPLHWSMPDAHGYLRACKRAGAAAAPLRSSFILLLRTISECRPLLIQAFTPGFGNSGFPPADGGGFGASAFQGTLAPAQARESFTPYGAGVYAPAPPQQYAAPFSAPVPAAQKGPISYAAVAVRLRIALGTS